MNFIKLILIELTLTLKYCHRTNQSEMKTLILYLIILLIFPLSGYSQQIIDSCFTSAATGTSFPGSSNIIGFDGDLMQWSGSAWVGGWSHANNTIPPPTGNVGCRAVFMGSASSWTTGGEGFGLRLNAPLVAGSTYTFYFTYVSHGVGSNGSFSPRFLTNSSGSMTGAYTVGFMPAVGYTWTTNSITFTAVAAQAGHTWIFLHSGPSGSSGLVSSLCSNCTSIPNCNVNLGNDTTVCPGESVSLDGTTAGATYLWQDGSSLPTFQASSPGTYYVTVNVSGCMSSDTIQIFNFPDPTPSLGNDTTICYGESLLLDASFPGGIYSWQDGSMNAQLIASASGTYDVTVVANGCTGADTIQLTVNPEIIIDLGLDTSLCTGTSLTLDATIAGASYLWQDGSSAAQYIATVSGIYAVTVTMGGCSESDSIVVTFDPSLYVFLGNDTILCEGSSMVLQTGYTGASYNWQDGSVNPTFLVSSSGNYSVTVTSGSCSGTDTISISVVAPPILELGGPEYICSGETIYLNAGAPGLSYLWQDGNTSPDYTVSSAGTYSVTVSNGPCSVSDVLLVYMSPDPAVDLGLDQLLCFGTAYIFDVTQAGMDYLWQDGSTLPYYIVHEPGLYSVEVYNSCSSISDTVMIEMQDCECQLYIPNAFSPNEDDLNSWFSPVSNCEFTIYELWIYNRWGQLVFYSDQPMGSWDGYFDGLKADQGVYAYRFAYRHETSPRLLMTQGYIVVIR